MRVLIPLVGLLGCTAAAGEPVADEGPVVLELFTSQGCSSCPPADELLGKLAAAGVVEGRKLAPLAFHVDYWNDLGWADPFSLSAWTARQQTYAHALRDDRVYTPELVVAGGAGMVGSSASRVREAIAAAPRQLAIAATATWATSRLAVTATAPADADVWVAVWEDGTRTKVSRGENAGATLAGERVVRRLERVATAGHASTIEIPLDRSWYAAGAVAFAQRADRRIIGATLLSRRP
jgi:hypothetical protein